MPALPVRALVLFAALGLLSGCALSGRNGAETPLPDSRAKDAAYGLFLRALEHEMRGNFPEAEFGYRKVVEADPAAVHVLYLIAGAALQKGDADEALRFIKRAVALDTVQEYFSFYGAVLYRLKRLPEAAAAYETALRLAPEDPRLKEILASLYERLKRPERAAVLYRELMERHNEKWHGEKLAQLLVELKRPAEARDLVEEILAGDPKASRARLVLSALVKPMAPDSVSALYRRLFQRSPDAVELRRDYGAWLIRHDRMEEAADVYAEICARGGDVLDRKTYGILCTHLQRYEPAVAALKPLMEEKEDGDIAYYLGNALLGLKRHEEAAACFARAIAMDSLNASAWVNRGVAFMRQNRHDSATVVFRSAEDRFPGDAYMNYLAGMAYGSDKQYAEAAEQYRAALAKSPDNVEILFSLAAAFERLGRFLEAETLFLKVLGLDSLHHRTLNYLGYMYAEKGIKLDAAEKYVRKALDLDPENGAYMDSYGWVCFQKKQPEKAEAFIDSALKAGEQDPVIYEHMALIQEALSRHERALEMWRKVLELEPGNEKAKNAVSAGEKRKR